MLRHPVPVMVYSLLLFALCPILVKAKADNATSPIPRQGWTAPPMRRGTIDILWSCLSTLFICIWGCLHPDLPHRNESSSTIYRRKLGHCLFAAIIPEYMVVLATRDFIIALWHSTDMQIRGHDYWTITHSLLAYMGGIVSESSYERISLGEIWKIDKENLSSLSLKAIGDKSKSSSIVKTIACFQVGWLIMQCIGRQIQGLPITPLEIATVAYAANCFLVYGLWWKKPLDIWVPFEIVSGEVATLSGRARNFSNEGYSPSYPFTEFKERVKETKFGTLKVCTFDSNGSPLRVTATLGAVSIAIFGAIHLAAWNNNFATPIEKILWRISSSLATGIPLVLLLFIIGGLFENFESLSAFLTMLLAIPYTICRIYLMVEPFVSLRSLPADSYDTVKWTSFIPHI